MERGQAGRIQLKDELVVRGLNGEDLKPTISDATQDRSPADFAGLLSCEWQKTELYDINQREGVIRCDMFSRKQRIISFVKTPKKHPIKWSRGPESVSHLGIRKKRNGVPVIEAI